MSLCLHLICFICSIAIEHTENLLHSVLLAHYAASSTFFLEKGCTPFVVDAYFLGHILWI